MKRQVTKSESPDKQRRYVMNVNLYPITQNCQISISNTYFFFLKSRFLKKNNRAALTERYLLPAANC